MLTHPKTRVWSDSARQHSVKKLLSISLLTYFPLALTLFCIDGMGYLQNLPHPVYTANNWPSASGPCGPLLLHKVAYLKKIT